MLGVMHVLTRHAFPVAFEWRRLVHLVIVVGGLAAAGELALPTSGFVGFVSRALVWLAIPLVLWGTGFAHAAELDQARALLGRLRSPGPRPADSRS
jgi:hypothetical protein